MKILVNVALGIVTLWITTSVAVSSELDQGKHKQEDVHKLYYNQETNEDTDDSEEGSLGEGAPVLTTVSNTTSTAASNSGLPSRTSSLLESSLAVTMNEHEIQELNRILEQTPTTSSSPKIPHVTEMPMASKIDASIRHHSNQVTEQTTATRVDANSVEHHSPINTTSVDGSMMANATSNSMTSAPDVVQPTKGTKTYIDDIFKQSLAWLGDTYTLSIVVPILAGFLFAIVIIVTLLTFACIRRRCRRRRLRRKLLPDTIRKMGPSDRARLLAETSDEEF